MHFNRIIRYVYCMVDHKPIVAVQRSKVQLKEVCRLRKWSGLNCNSGVYIDFCKRKRPDEINNHLISTQSSIS